MQHVTISATTTINQVAYTSTIVKKEATQKIILFVSILACLVAAVNI